MASSETLRQDAKLKYRFFDLPEDVRRGHYGEFNRLCDQHRWHEAELMLSKLEKTAKAAGWMPRG